MSFLRKQWRDKMDFDWKSLVRTIAPTIGTVLSGGNPLVGIGIKAVSNALLGKPDGSEDEISMAIQNASPEDLIKLKTADQSFKTEMAKIGLDEKKLAFEDIAGARGRQIEHEKATGKTDVNLYVLAWTVVSGFFGLMALLCFKALPADSNGVIFMLFGALSTGFGQILGYFFGSSKSSADKTKLLKG